MTSRGATADSAANDRSRRARFASTPRCRPLGDRRSLSAFARPRALRSASWISATKERPAPLIRAMSSVASGETSSAAALGVAARTSATKSTIVTSVSWPIALTTGAREAATARASPSSLKHHRSSSDPPPRATMTTSTRSAMNARARRRLAGASGPWTRAGAITMCAIGYRRRKIVTMSCTTAPISEVTTPIFSGNPGRGRFRAASNNPSAASFLRVFWYAAQNAPTPAGVAALMRSWTDPRRGNTSTSPETTTSMPSSRSKPIISASSRNRVHEIWAVASFKVKNTWPAGARWRLLTSPRTRIRERIGFARTVSRITRASWVTVSACGAPGRLSQVTAIGSMVPSRRRRRSYQSFAGRGGRKCAARPGSLRREQVRRVEQRVEADADFGERFLAALLPVDHRDDVLDPRTVRPQPVDGASQGAAGRDDVFDEQHAVPAVQLSLEVFLRPVLLRGFPNHKERLSAREADRGGDRHGAELDPRDPIDTSCVRRQRVRGEEPRDGPWRDREAQQEPAHDEVVLVKAGGFRAPRLVHPSFEEGATQVPEERAEGEDRGRRKRRSGVAE